MASRLGGQLLLGSSGQHRLQVAVHGAMAVHGAQEVTCPPAGNNWGLCESTGQGETGCGPQEEFRACSDIAIRPRGRGAQWALRLAQLGSGRGNLLHQPWRAAGLPKAAYTGPGTGSTASSTQLKSIASTVTSNGESLQAPTQSKWKSSSSFHKNKLSAWFPQKMPIPLMSTKLSGWNKSSKTKKAKTAPPKSALESFKQTIISNWLTKSAPEIPKSTWDRKPSLGLETKSRKSRPETGLRTVALTSKPGLSSVAWTLPHIQPMLGNKSASSRMGQAAPSHPARTPASPWTPSPWTPSPSKPWSSSGQWRPVTSAPRARPRMERLLASRAVVSSLPRLGRSHRPPASQGTRDQDHQPARPGPASRNTQPAASSQGQARSWIDIRWGPRKPTWPLEMDHAIGEGARQVEEQVEVEQNQEEELKQTAYSEINYSNRWEGGFSFFTSTRGRKKLVGSKAKRGKSFWSPRLVGY